MPPLGLVLDRSRWALVPPADQPVVARINGWLARIAWFALAGAAFGLILVPVHPDGERDTAAVALIATIAGLATVLLGRLATAALAWPQRRTATGVLLVSLVLWAIGASILTVAPDSGLGRFPAPGENLFLGAYALLVMFLMLDSTGRGRVDVAAATEAAVIVGGAICVAGTVLLSPAAARIHGEGIGPLLALLYPLIDLLLASAVLADLLLHRRGWSRQSVGLLLGFSLLAGSDSAFGWDVSGGSFDFGVVPILGYAVGLTLIVQGACGPRPEVPARSGRYPVVLPFMAALVAVEVLAFSPPGVRYLYLVVPAVVTLLAAGARLTLALREAQGATEAYRLSLTDDLTELPNRRALMARVHAEAPPGTPMTLLLLDLDRFKDVNDTLGHIAGDHVLQQLSERLRDHLGDVLVARLGGDEFAIVMESGDEDAALQAAARIGELVAQPLEVYGHTFIMHSSVGVAISHHQDTRADLLRRADVAMYQAKTQRMGALLYDPDRDEFTTERLKLAEFLRRGIPAGQLRVWYQPQVSTLTHRLTGVEALVRWEHPELGVLQPSGFLTIARQTGLMPVLTETVVQLVLDDITHWQQAGARFHVSLNIAPPELLNPALLERVLEQIDAARLPAGTLVLEVTEDSLLTDPERARLALLEIRRHHVQVAIDDYGTGYSSLAYLRDLPVHELKLDQSFVTRIRTDQRSRIIVASTNQMAQGLGLRTVAEGVENAQIAETVRELGVDVMQGFFIARPMPADDLLSWLEQWHQLPGPPVRAAAPLPPQPRGEIPNAATAPAPARENPDPRARPTG